jgi:hypothetical protein
MPEDREAALLPVATTTRRGGVIAQIKRAIVLGSLQPGEKLTEARLSSDERESSDGPGGAQSAGPGRPARPGALSAVTGGLARRCGTA